MHDSRGCQLQYFHQYNLQYDLKCEIVKMFNETAENA